MSQFSRLAKILPALALLALALPGSALGQATRTWVSGVGDDVNPCSRTAPCKTFAGAISKTAPGGEINVLDPGGFGAVTITKSLTIKAEGFTAGVLVSGTNGIVISAANTDKITLKGLDMNGLGTGLGGVKVLSAGQVTLLNDEIYGFQTGVAVVPTSPATRTVILSSHIHDNGVGVFNAPGNGAVSFTAVTLRQNNIQSNRCGAAVSSFGSNNGNNPDPNSDCGAAGAGSGINQTAVISAYNNGFNNNTGTAGASGVFSRGSAAVFEIGSNDITGNTVGINRPDGGTVRSYGNNMVSDNGSTMAPNASAVMTRKKGRKAPHRRRGSI